jgi:methylenetetrahydrofolate reductase (NADPH)
MGEYFTGQRPVVSFEVFPPKTDGGMRRLKESTLQELIELRPDFMTVTYGAGGSTRSKTIDVARHILDAYGMNVACHLTCVGASPADLDEILQEIRGGGIHNIVALRGDPPRGQTDFQPAPDGYAYASELLNHIRGWEQRQGLPPAGIGVAGYPEKHPEAPTMEDDVARLREKVELGADTVVTQLFYENRFYWTFLEHTRRAGITAPIMPGLLPIISARQVMKMTALSGATLPQHLDDELAACGEDAEKSLDVGIRYCIEQARDLLQNGAPGIHFYVLNRADHMRRILDGIEDLLKRS